MSAIRGVRMEACFPGCSLHLSVSRSAGLPVLFLRLLGKSVFPLFGATRAGVALGCSYRHALQLPQALPSPLSQNRGFQTGPDPQTHIPRPLGFAEANTSQIWDLFLFLFFSLLIAIHPL